MDRLCEEGELVRYKEPNRNAWYYQYSDEHKHCNRHMHAQCSTCGKIFHLEKPFVDEFTDRIRTTYGLDVSPSDTIIIGQCEDCGQTEAGEDPCGVCGHRLKVQAPGHFAPEFYVIVEGLQKLSYERVFSLLFSVSQVRKIHENTKNKEKP